MSFTLLSRVCLGVPPGKELKSPMEGNIGKEEGGQEVDEEALMYLKVYFGTLISMAFPYQFPGPNQRSCND